MQQELKKAQLQIPFGIPSPVSFQLVIPRSAGSQRNGQGEWNKQDKFALPNARQDRSYMVTVPVVAVGSCVLGLILINLTALRLSLYFSYIFLYEYSRGPKP